jgi:hypothetical protein
MIIFLIMINIGGTMDVEQVKDEIRKLNRIDKKEICRWIDEEAAIGLLFRIGVPRPSKLFLNNGDIFIFAKGDVTAQDLCVPGYARTVRDVPAEMKSQVTGSTASRRTAPATTRLIT